MFRKVDGLWIPKKLTFTANYSSMDVATDASIVQLQTAINYVKLAKLRRHILIFIHFFLRWFVWMAF